MGKAWSEAELNKLRVMKGNGHELEVIADSLGRTKKAVQAKFDYLNLTPEMKRRRQASEADRRKGVIRSRQPDGKLPRAETPQTVLADRERRLSAQRSLTAILCGDPPKGYSALDRKRQEARQ